MNERRGSGRLFGPGSRDILDFRGGGDGNGAGDGLVGHGYGDVTRVGEGDGSGDSHDHRSTIIPEPGINIEDEAEVRTIRGFGRSDEDDICNTNTRIRIGIGDAELSDIDGHAGDEDARGGAGGDGRNTGIRDMIRVEGEDSRSPLRSRSGMEMEVDLRSRSGMDMEVDLGTGMDRGRDVLMRMDPDMIGILKTIYGWGDREVSSHPSLPPPPFLLRSSSVRAVGLKREAKDHQADLFSSSPSPSRSDCDLPPRQLQAIGTRHLQIWSEYPNHPESAGWRKRLPYIRFKRKRKVKMEVVSSDGSGEEEQESGSHSEEAEFGCK